MILTAIAIIFILGYLAIALESYIKVNKSASALFLGASLWLVWFRFQGSPYGEGLEHVSHQLFDTFGDLAQILFFLMGAMTIVAIIDANDGFSIITSRIKTDNAKILMWIISGISFFLSAILDNLTTTIVMMTLCHKMVSDAKDRLFFAGLIVIAANAGGAWSPIGDVTTTMLWIGKQISTVGIIESLIVPSIVCLLVPLAVMSFIIKGKVRSESAQVALETQKPSSFERNILFIAGIGGLLMVPIIKSFFHVPPYIAMFFVLGFLWIVVELLGRKHANSIKRLSIFHILKEVDVSSVLFFAGIMLAVGCLGATGQLAALAKILDENIGDIRMITLAIGALSAIVDNVPLVAATMKMYAIDNASEVFREDGLFWSFVSYCAGTGGSMLIIGSAAGVAAMGMEKNLTFIWYLKKIAPLAALGYVAGAGVYLVIQGAL
ncbi:MAG: sodium:proton antiporter NhaD [Candidatus Fibromonas sp.]|jgi:Na+/H+ antiporter NhaD/arsenite permease-like protein|nr:sodium:proton antiporter NhaD [Candidatus Fibromonas sp.]